MLSSDLCVFPHIPIKSKIALFVFKCKVNSPMLNKVLSFLLVYLIFLTASGQNDRSRWVDSVFNSLTPEQRISQLFMVPVSTYASQTEIEDLTELLKKNGFGGIYITGGGPLSHVRLLNQLQKASKVPLLVGMPAEWGLAQTLDSTMGFQKPMVAAAWKKDSLMVMWGKEIARQMKLLGIHINFAPNADDEIFSGDYLRYFGNEEAAVARHTVSFTKVMQAEGIQVVAKHLPRRAASESSLKDSSILLNLNQLDTIGFYAFQQLINQGVNGILTSYLHFSIQNDKGVIPAGISQVFISDILKIKLNYQGLVFSEVKNFQKSAGKIRPGDAELLAFEAGNDVLMVPLNMNAAVKQISKRLKKNKKDNALQQQLDMSLKKILASKFDSGLHHVKMIDADNLLRKLHTPESYLLKHQLAEAAITVVKNADDFLPIRSLNTNSFVCLSLGKDAENGFTHSLKRYASFKRFSIKDVQDTSKIVLLPGDIIMIGIFPYASDLERGLRTWLNRLMEKQKVIITHFGNPLTIEPYKNATSLIAAYTDQDDMMDVVPQMIFGALPAMGLLPVNLDPFNNHPSIVAQQTGRLSYTVPEAAGLDSHTLDRINAIVQEAIDLGATPGAHVLVAKDGKVIYDQSFGWLTYENKVPVNDETIYDLASLTKVSATLQATMFMYDKGLIDINKKASFYLPELKATNKKDITLIDMLTHQSGLVPFMPLWPLTVKDSVYLPYYYSSIRNEIYPLQVAPNLFAANVLPDSIWGWIVKSKMQDKPPRTPYSYRYSDLGFMMLKHMAQTLLHQPMNEFLQQNLYGPLGAYSTGFNPLDRFPAQRIAPTEEDKIYRRSTVIGTVHDERAAMMGGISGHAGLFSTANDLAKVGQMLLQEGNYGGTTFYKPETVRSFTTKQFSDSRRGLGWDKPVPSDWSSPTSFLASSRTFGHTGFTGTCMWIDPEFNLVYIFLSNRVYPDRNNKLLNANIRPRIQEVVYQAIFNYCSNKN